MMKWIIVGSAAAVFSLIDAVMFALLSAAVIGFLSWLIGAQHPRDVALIAASITAAIAWIATMTIRMNKISDAFRKYRLKQEE